MNSRERIRTIINGQIPDRTGFWMGNPYPETWPILHHYFGTSSEEELRLKLGDDFRWITPSFFSSTYPVGWRGFRGGEAKRSHGQAGPLAYAETLNDVETHDWPNAEGLDFSEALEKLSSAGAYYRAGGMWTSFYHDEMDLFGFDEYLIKMHTNPEVVEAVTDRVCQFYYQANEMFFRQAGDQVDAFFFGNDFGTQQDLIISPKLFDRFVMPWFQRFAEQGHRFGRQVILHSCGSIHRVIPRLISAGVECLHPLQALAKNMDALTLAQDFKGKIAFLGGVDTQDLLIYGTPLQIKDEVRRLRALLGPCLIISPSHEAILPDVPPRNIAAMAEAAVE
jgi:uroporphyrinogen decarboxylase